MSDVVPHIRRGRPVHGDVVLVHGDDSGVLELLLRAHSLQVRRLDDLADITTMGASAGVLAALASTVRPETSLAAANELCVSHGITWLPVGAAGPSSTDVGPLIVPGSSACYDCLAQPHRETVEYRPGDYRELEGRQPAGRCDDAAMLRLTMAALILARWVHGRDRRQPGRRYRIATRELTIASTWLPRRLDCATCGAVAHTAAFGSSGSQR